MNEQSLHSLTVDELVAQFVILALEQDKAEGDIPRFNRLFMRMDGIKKELKRRPGDQRRALMSLYKHPNIQVRLAAVKATLAVAPVAARAELEVIARSSVYPQAGDAGMAIEGLDTGTFKPT